MQSTPVQSYDTAATDAPPLSGYLPASLSTAASTTKMNSRAQRWSAPIGYVPCSRIVTCEQAATSSEADAESYKEWVPTTARVDLARRAHSVVQSDRARREVEQLGKITNDVLARLDMVSRKASGALLCGGGMGVRAGQVRTWCLCMCVVAQLSSMYCFRASHRL